jgi:quercetin dioxygenase-like cupin family protein
MIARSADGIKKTFLGVDFVVLARGPESMVTRMDYKATDKPPAHQHPHSQSGYVLSGRYRLQFLEFNQELAPGDSYAIPGNVEHRIEIIEPGQIVDVFAPPRKDYL